MEVLRKASKKDIVRAYFKNVYQHNTFSLMKLNQIKKGTHT